jgi:hypothetical protein
MSTSHTFPSASIGIGWLAALLPGAEPVIVVFLCPVSEPSAWEVPSDREDREDREVSVMEHESQTLLPWLPEHEQELLGGIGVRLVKSCP